MTQTEMLMSLACFIDIHESLGLVTMDTFPLERVMQFKTLIRLNLIQLHPYSLVKKGCVTYMADEQMVDVSAAAAAAA